MVRRLIIASNRLPVSVREEQGVLSLSRSNGGLATALASLFDEHRSLWVGWTGMRRQLSDDQLQSLSFPPSLLPVNLAEQEIELYYDAFANGILWPIAHGLAPTVPFNDRLWDAVASVTDCFADAIVNTAKPNDIIWIHDYHLLLLPGVLRRRGVKNKIGFFLHTPFPTLRSARAMPHLRDLLQSLLSADLVGLQTQADVRRFASLTNSLDLKKPRSCTVKAFPIGIDFDSFDAPANEPEIAMLVRKFKSSVHGRTVIFSLSRLDYTKGIIAQLNAYEQLLRDGSLSGSIMYRLNIAPSRESMLEYRELRQDVEALVQDINQKFGTAGWQPIEYTYENLGQSEITAWYRVADIHLNTPIADGMNLIAKEYVAARKQPGTLIISSTMGAAKQLRQALIVPPKNSGSMARALRLALAMPKSERQERWAALREEVKEHQASHWADDFLRSLAK